MWEVFIHRRDGQKTENKEGGVHGQGTIDEKRHQERQHDEGNGKDEHRGWRTGETQHSIQQIINKLSRLF